MTDHVVPRVRYGDVIGGDLVAGQQLELLRVGVVDDEELGPVPVIVHEGVVATPDLLDGLDEADAHTWFRHRLQIRTMLAGRGAPRVLVRLHDERHPDIPVGFVEAHAGDIRLLQLVPRHGFGTALPGTLEAQGAARLPIGICLRIARDLAEPYAVIEAVGGADTFIHVQPRDIFIGEDGVVRSLVDPSAWPWPDLGGPDDDRPFPTMRNGRADLAFMSPERLRGLPIDARDGMHMLGLLLFALVVGEHPWVAEVQAVSVASLLRAMMIAPLEVDAPFLGKDGQAMWGFTDEGPRWRIDAAPVSHRAWARFCAETNRAPPTWWRGPMPPLEQEELAVGGVSLHEAAAYAAHFGKVVPTDEQWQRALDQLGAARLQVGAIWEWTMTPHLSGVVVRGGRFRDSVDVVSDGSTSSWANRAGPDLGFRGVARDGL